MNKDRKKRLQNEVRVLKESLARIEAVSEEELAKALNLGDSARGDEPTDNVDLLCTITQNLEDAIEDLEKFN